MKLSDGTDLSTLSPDDLAALIAKARRQHSGAIEKPEPLDTRTTCVVSPYTQACTRCGHPGGTSVCEPMISVQYSATLAMRAHR